MATNTTRDNLAIELQTYFDGLVSQEFVAAQSFAEQIAEDQAAILAEDPPTYLVFHWLISDILEAVKMVSAYKGKNVVSQEKNPVSRLEDVSLSDDEDNMMQRLAKKAASKVYGLIAAYGKDITGGYLFDPDVEEPVAYVGTTVYNEGDLFYSGEQLYLALCDETPIGTDPTDTDYFLAVGEEYNTYKKIVFTVNYSTNMDQSMIEVLDDNLEDCLVKDILLAWYKVIGEVQMIPIAQSEYDDAVSEVKSSMWYRKIPTRRRVELL
jgi:hypothetical protein